MFIDYEISKLSQYRNECENHIFQLKKSPILIIPTERTIHVCKDRNMIIV